MPDSCMIAGKTYIAVNARAAFSLLEPAILA
jgi:hypothetical protein